MSIISKVKKGLAVLLATAAVGCSSVDKPYNPLNSSTYSSNISHVMESKSPLDKEKYTLSYDRLKSPETGVDGIISANNLQSRVVDNIPGTDNIPMRALRHVLWNIPVSTWLTTLNHEYFGHCFRYRDLYNEEGEISLGSPWKGGGGSASWESSTENWDKERRDLDNKCISDRITSAAGLEASNVLSKKLRKKIFNGDYSQDDAILYSCSKLDYPLYYFGEKTTDFEGDITSYIGSFNLPDFDNIEEKKRMSMNDIKKNAYFHLIDPFLIKSFVDQWNYVAHGKKENEKFDKFPFACSGSLTPSGIEYVLNFYGKDISTYIRAGKNSIGVGAELEKEINSEFVDLLKFNVDLFKQKIPSYIDVNASEYYAVKKIARKPIV